MKTSELTGAALDWAVCIAKGCQYTPDVWLHEYKYLEGPRYSTDWDRGGPMIERAELCVVYRAGGYWLAYWYDNDGEGFEGVGDTPLIAAMRCYVASKLGDEVDVPEELT